MDDRDSLVSAFWAEYARLASDENAGRSESDRDTSPWRSVSDRLVTGDPRYLPLVTKLVQQAPKDEDGWMSYLVGNPLSDYWQASSPANRQELLRIAKHIPDLYEILVLLGYATAGDSNES